MSHQTIRSDNSKDGTPENCLQSYQYVWMSHWTQTRSRSVDHSHNQLSNCYEPGEISHRNKLLTSLAEPETDSHSSNFMKEFRESNKVRSTETSKSKHFPMFKSSHYTDGNFSLEIGESSSNQEGILKSKLGSISEYDPSHGQTDKSLPSMLDRTPTNPQTSNSCHRDFLGQQFHNIPPIRPTRLYHGLCELPRNTTSVHGKETMKISTTIDSGGPSKFSKTTHHIFNEEDNNLNLSGGVEILRESILTNLKRETPSMVFSFSPGYAFNLKQGVKLQPLDSSTESEGKVKIKNGHFAVDLKNASSAETDTMDMDTLQENCLVDVASSIVKKDIDKVQKTPTSEAALNLVNDKSKGRSPNIVLPDINLVLPPIPSAVDGDTSTSRTHSMDASDFLFRATNMKSSVCANGPLELYPCSRWVKRLKPSTSNHVAYGTKSSKMAEPSSQEKVNELFNKITYFGKSSSEPKTSKCEERVAIDQVADLQTNAESSSVGLVRAGQGITLSHAWIQRLCHNPLSVARESPCSKTIQHDIYKMQYPSIAAMALMGKAMTGLSQCGLRKEGSLVAWNT